MNYYFFPCLCSVHIHTYCFSKICPFKSCWRKQFILNITVYLLNMKNESLHIHGIRKMKLCPFAQYVEWKCALLQNTWNNIDLQTDLNCAYLQNIDNETVWICWIRRTKLRHIAQYPSFILGAYPGLSHYESDINISSSLRSSSYHFEMLAFKMLHDSCNDMWNLRKELCCD